MRLTQNAIEASNKIRTRTLLALELNCSDVTIQRHLKANEDNGSLTTPGALRVIRAETGLSTKQILEQRTPTTMA